jgi:hypothetical protein
MHTKEENETCERFILKINSFINCQFMGEFTCNDMEEVENMVKKYNINNPVIISYKKKKENYYPINKIGD